MVQQRCKKISIRWNIAIFSFIISYQYSTALYCFCVAFKPPTARLYSDCKYINVVFEAFLIFLFLFFIFMFISSLTNVDRDRCHHIAIRNVSVSYFKACSKFSIRTDRCQCQCFPQWLPVKSILIKLTAPLQSDVTDGVGTLAPFTRLLWMRSVFLANRFVAVCMYVDPVCAPPRRLLLLPKCLQGTEIRLNMRPFWNFNQDLESVWLEEWPSTVFSLMN